ncbi:MAG: exosortase/archaeosortase family protein [candidate division WS1 bacterium]|jgi:exosortase|nr:exosortase/archaeosortase family protein [candidate division WS1 bacterium]
MANGFVTKLVERVRQDPATAIWVAATGVLLLAMYANVGSVFVRRWFSDSSQYHCMVVPPLVGWFIWRRWPQLKAMQHRPSLVGFAIFGAGLLMYWASARTGTRLLAGAALPVLIAGVVAAVYGTRAFGLTAAPFALLIFAIPIPEHAIGMLAMPLQRISALITGAMTPLVGLEVIQQGVNLDLNGFTFVVAEECSGMRSLIALLLTGFVLVELSGLSRNLKITAVAIIPALVLFANVTRLVFVLLIGQYFGPDFALGVVVHGFSDLIVYGAAVLSLILIIGWLHDLQDRRAKGPTQDDPAPREQREDRQAKPPAAAPDDAAYDGGILLPMLSGGREELPTGAGGD